MVAKSESRHVSGNCKNAALSVIPDVSDYSKSCPDSSLYHHPISLAFSGNPPFPLGLERHVTYFKGSCVGLKG